MSDHIKRAEYSQEEAFSYAKDIKNALWKDYHQNGKSPYEPRNIEIEISEGETIVFMAQIMSGSNTVSVYNSENTTFDRGIGPNADPELIFYEKPQSILSKAFGSAVNNLRPIEDKSLRPTENIKWNKSPQELSSATPIETISLSAKSEMPVSYKFDNTVLEAQRLLVEQGYDLGAYGENGDGLDGKRGHYTNTAIKEYMDKHGLAEGTDLNGIIENLKDTAAAQNSIEPVSLPPLNREKMMEALTRGMDNNRERNNVIGSNESNIRIASNSPDEFNLNVLEQISSPVVNSEVDLKVDTRKADIIALKEQFKNLEASVEDMGIYVGIIHYNNNGIKFHCWSRSISDNSVSKTTVMNRVFSDPEKIGIIEELVEAKLRLELDPDGNGIYNKQDLDGAIFLCRWGRKRRLGDHPEGIFDDIVDKVLKRIEDDPEMVAVENIATEVKVENYKIRLTKDFNLSALPPKGGIKEFLNNLFERNQEHDPEEMVNKSLSWLFEQENKLAVNKLFEYDQEHNPKEIVGKIVEALEQTSKAGKTLIDYRFGGSIEEMERAFEKDYLNDMKAFSDPNAIKSIQNQYNLIKQAIEEYKERKGIITAFNEDKLEAQKQENITTPDAQENHEIKVSPPSTFTA
ncbi:MAG: hypothetical protein KAJ86_01925 [Alphaproteobacteria bacterium]|nr:hypothetical protein [Alphaproteobacteria bacterium]